MADLTRIAPGPPANFNISDEKCHLDECRHIETGKALVDELFYMKAAG
jgi:hypothetical protein